jgi:hypothetical protein
VRRGVDVGARREVHPRNNLQHCLIVSGTEPTRNAESGRCGRRRQLTGIPQYSTQSPAGNTFSPHTAATSRAPFGDSGTALRPANPTLRSKGRNCCTNRCQISLP